MPQVTVNRFAALVPVRVTCLDLRFVCAAALVAAGLPETLWSIVIKRIVGFIWRSRASREIARDPALNRAWNGNLPRMCAIPTLGKAEAPLILKHLAGARVERRHSAVRE